MFMELTTHNWSKPTNTIKIKHILYGNTLLSTLIHALITILSLCQNVAILLQHTYNLIVPRLLDDKTAI